MKENSTKQRKKIDMLNGSLFDKIVLFAIPIAISSILQQLFNSADSAVIGKFVGAHALAAVGVNGPLVSLFVNLLAGSSVGANVVVGAYLGSKQYDRIKTAIGTCVAFSLVGGFVIALIGQFISEPVLHLIGTPDEILPLSTLYLKIYFAAMPFIVLYNFLSAILRAGGDTKRPLIALFLAGIINVILNIILVVVFGLGVEGVAIATLVSNIISSMLLIYWLMNDDGPIVLYPETIKLHWRDFSKVIAIGLPAGLQGAAFAFSNICIQSAINAFGSDVIAGNTVALNYEAMAISMSVAFSQTVVTFISVNFAARNIDRCKKTTLYCFLANTISYIIIGLVMNIFADKLLLLFTSEPIIIEQAKIRMGICTALLFLSAAYEIFGGTIRGLGHSLLPAVIVLIGTCLFRLVWIYILLPEGHSIENIYMVYPMTWAITSVITTIFYFKVTRREYDFHGTK